MIALEQSLEQEREVRREKLREGNAERQRRRRAKSKDARHACHAVTERDPFPLKESSPTPPEENNPYPESPSLPTRLPADFTIDEEDLAFGKAEGLNAGEIQRAVEDMRLWAAEAVGDKALHSDWHATVRRFMRRDADAKRAGKGKPPKIVPLGKAAVAKTVHVKRDTPQGEAWWAYIKTTTGRSPPMDKKGGWRFPSEWPNPEPYSPTCAKNRG